MLKKGETRREQILLAAESLFYVKGYEQTTIQDILDVLNLSKGGFYHYFDTKLSLLEAICSLRAEESVGIARETAAKFAGDPVEELNALVACGGMLRPDKLDYLSLLIRVAYRDDGALMRDKLKQRTLELMLPLMDAVIAEGVSVGAFFLPRANLAGELVLRLCAQFTDEVALVLSQPGEEAEQLGHILAKLELYRHTIERMLSAPFGSIILYEMEQLATVFRGLAARKDHQAG